MVRMRLRGDSEKDMWLYREQKIMCEKNRSIREEEEISHRLGVPRVNVNEREKNRKKFSSPYEA